MAIEQTLFRFLRFCLVGGSGVFVDMAVLFLLSDTHTLGLNLSLGKACAAEVAILNNFIWNDLWTFRDLREIDTGRQAAIHRFARFNLICLAGIVLNVILLNAQVRFLHLDVYAANLIAIFLVSVWNFGMNIRFGWCASFPPRHST